MERDEFGGIVINAPANSQQPAAPAGQQRDEFGGIVLDSGPSQQRDEFGGIVLSGPSTMDRMGQKLAAHPLQTADPETAALQMAAAHIEAENARRGDGGYVDPSEQESIKDIYRAALNLPTASGRQRDVQKTVVGMKSQYENAANMASGLLARTGTGILNTAHTASELMFNPASILSGGDRDAQQFIAGLNENIAANTQADPTTAGAKVGSFLGNAIPMIPGFFAKGAQAAKMAVDATAGLLASGQFGNVRSDVVEKRRAIDQENARRAQTGEAPLKQISVGEELGAAALSAAAEYVFEKWGLGSIKSVEHSAIKHVVGNALFQYAKTAGINYSEEVFTQVAQNAVEKILLDHKKAQDLTHADLTEGTLEAGNMGAAMGIAGKAVSNKASTGNFLGNTAPKTYGVQPNIGGIIKPPVEQTRLNAPEAYDAATPTLPPLLDGKAMVARVHNPDGSSRTVSVDFHTPTDKALYSMAQPQHGKVQAEAKQFLLSQGMDEAAIPAAAKAVFDGVQSDAAKAGDHLTFGAPAIVPAEAPGINAAASQPAVEPYRVGKIPRNSKQGAISTTPVEAYGVATEQAAPAPQPNSPMTRVAASSEGYDVLPAGQQAPRPAPVEERTRRTTLAQEAATRQAPGITFHAPPSKEHADIAAKLRATRGTEIVYFDGPEGSEASKFSGFKIGGHDGTIFVNRNKVGEGLREVIGHEFIHDLASTRPDLFEAIHNSIAPDKRDAFQKQYAKDYADKGHKVAIGSLREEGVARPAGYVTALDNGVWRAAIGENTGLLHAVKELYHKFVAKYVHGDSKLRQSLLDAFESTAKNQAPLKVAEKNGTQAEKVYGNVSHPITVNPNGRELRRLVAGSDKGVVRGLENKATGEKVYWDATYAEHHSVAEKLGWNSVNHLLEGKEKGPDGETLLGNVPSTMVLDATDEAGIEAYMDTVGPLRAVTLPNGKIIVGAAEETTHAELAKEAGITAPLSPDARKFISPGRRGIVVSGHDLQPSSLAANVDSQDNRGPITRMMTDTGFNRTKTSNEVEFYERINTWVQENYKDGGEGTSLRDLAVRAANDIRSILTPAEQRKYEVFYTKERAKERIALQARFPELKGQLKWMMYNAINAIGSNGTRLTDNVAESVEAWEHYRTGAKFEDSTFAKGGPVMVRGGPTQATKKEHYKAFSRIVEALGEEGTIKFFRSTHTQGELNAFRKGIGYKTGIDGPKVKEAVQAATGQTEQIEGSFFFGPKLGAYMQNGFGNQAYQTADLWEGVFYRLFTGKGFEFKTDPKTGDIEVIKHPVGGDDQRRMAEFGKLLEEELKSKTPSGAQAQRWYAIKKAVANLGYTKGGSMETRNEATQRILAQKDRGGKVPAGLGRQSGGADDASGLRGSDAGPAEGAGEAIFGNVATDAAEEVKAGLRSRGHLPQVVSDLNTLRIGEAGAQVRRAEYTSGRLQEAVKQGYGKKAIDLTAAESEQIDRAFKGQHVTLPAPLIPVVKEMRDHADDLTKAIQGSGLVDPVLSTILGSRLGEYVNRSYRIFDPVEGAKWVKNIPAVVLDNAIKLIEGELTLAGHPDPKGRAPVYVEELLSDWRNGGVDSLWQKGKLGAKNLSILKSKGDISPEIRALMGEYKNPFVNYVKTISKQATLVANHRFLERTKTALLGTVLFEDGNAKSGYTTEIAAPEGSTMAPLNGMRTSPEIAAAFKQVSHTEQAAWAKAWAWANMGAKGSKTVLSMMTQVRNLNQMFFNLLSGHFRVSKYGQAAKAMWSDMTNKGDAGMQAYVEKLHRLGVFGDSIGSNELLAGLRDMGLEGIDAYTRTGVWPSVQRMVKAPIGAAAKVYAASDALGKAYGFENELARMKEMHPTWNLDQQEMAAAERIRNTYPTYSKLPPFIRNILRRQPFVGPFVSFWWEQFRTMGHAAIYAAEDLSSGTAAGRRAGAERLAGMSVLVGGMYAVQAISKALLGMGKEEEEDFRKFQPEWSRGNVMMFTGRDGKGRVNHTDLSALNPYSPLIDSAYALVAGHGTVADRLTNAFHEFFAPVLGEQLFTKVLVDVKRNKTETGSRVYNPEDSGVHQWTAILGHLMTAFEPGTLERIRHRIIPGIMGEESSFGDAFSPVKDIAAEVTGIKQRTFNFASGLRYQGSNFQQASSDVTNLFLREVTKPGKLDRQAVLDGYELMDQRRQVQWQDMYSKVQAAKRSGLTTAEIIASLRKANVGDETIKALLKGVYRPYDLRSETMKEVVKDHGRDQVPFKELVEMYRKSATIKLKEQE